MCCGFVKAAYRAIQFEISKFKRQGYPSENKKPQAVHLRAPLVTFLVEELFTVLQTPGKSSHTAPKFILVRVYADLIYNERDRTIPANNFC